MKENETICQDDKTLNEANKTQELLRVYSFHLPIGFIQIILPSIFIRQSEPAVINITAGKRAHTFLFIRKLWAK